MKAKTAVLGVSPNKRAAFAVFATLVLVAGALYWAFAHGLLAVVVHHKYVAEGDQGQVGCVASSYVSFVSNNDVIRQTFFEATYFTGSSVQSRSGSLGSLNNPSSVEDCIRVFSNASAAAMKAKGRTT